MTEIKKKINDIMLSCKKCPYFYSFIENLNNSIQTTYSERDGQRSLWPLPEAHDPKKFVLLKGLGSNLGLKAYNNNTHIIGLV